MTVLLVKINENYVNIKLNINIKSKISMTYQSVRTKTTLSILQSLYYKISQL